MSVASLQEEAEPVGHIVVGGKPTPGGAAEARRRAKRPVAPISLLMQENRINRDKALYRNTLVLQKSSDRNKNMIVEVNYRVPLQVRVDCSRVQAGPATSRLTEETRRRL